MADVLWAEEQARILTALGRIEGIEATAAWPREPPRKPVALVTLAGETTTDRRDDHRYLTELEYYVRVFAAKSADMRRVCSAVDVRRQCGTGSIFDASGYQKNNGHIACGPFAAARARPTATASGQRAGTL